MANAGFDPREAVNLWQNMIAAGGSRPPEWLSTHPEPNARIAELRARATGLLPAYERARSAGRRPTCGYRHYSGRCAPAVFSASVSGSVRLRSRASAAPKFEEAYPNEDYLPKD